MNMNIRVSHAMSFVCAAILCSSVTLASAAQPPETAAASAAYNAYLKDIKKGDMDAVMAGMVPEKAAQMKAQKDSKEFPIMWAMFTSMHATSVKVNDAHTDGEKLVMTVETTEGDKQIGTIDMQKVGDKWLVGQESYKATMGGG